MLSSTGGALPLCAHKGRVPRSSSGKMKLGSENGRDRVLLDLAQETRARGRVELTEQSKEGQPDG